MPAAASVEWMSCLVVHSSSTDITHCRVLQTAELWLLVLPFCRDILRSQAGLAEHHENYHEFCRLLGRLKTNYQLSELVRCWFGSVLQPIKVPLCICGTSRLHVVLCCVLQHSHDDVFRSFDVKLMEHVLVFVLQVAVENYNEWIQLVAQLTIDSLNSWQWAKDSVYYLLGLWSRLVSSMPYLKGDSPSLLEANVPKITQAYITSRLESVRLVLAQGNGLEEMLDAEEQLSEQLESLPYLVRFQYDKSR